MNGFLGPQPIPIFRQEFHRNREKVASLYRAGNILARVPKVSERTRTNENHWKDNMAVKSIAASCSLVFPQVLNRADFRDALDMVKRARRNFQVARAQDRSAQ